MGGYEKIQTLCQTSEGDYTKLVISVLEPLEDEAVLIVELLMSSSVRDMFIRVTVATFAVNMFGEIWSIATHTSMQRVREKIFINFWMSILSS